MRPDSGRASSRRVAAAMGLTLVLSSGGCALWGMEGGPGGSGIAAPTSSASSGFETAVLGADGVQRVTVSVGNDLRFRPPVVRARPGIVEFTFRNAGTTPHDVRLPQPAPSPSPGAGGPAGGRETTGNINGGQSSTVRVSVARPGRYPYPCLYHVSSGMTGTLEII